MAWKKIFSFLVCVSILGCSYSVRAAPVENDCSNQIVSLETQIEKTDDDIQNTMIEINKNDNNIRKVNVSVKETSKEISDRDEILKDYELRNRNTAKAIYENGDSTVTLLNAVLESKNFADFIGKTTAVNKVITANKEVMKKVHEDKKYIENKQNKLLSDRDKIQKLLSENKYRLNKLQSDKSKQADALIKLNSLKIPQDNASNSVNVYNQCLSAGHLIYGDDNVVNYAKNFLGIPYLWGGTFPSGFDCSGFVKYVYAHFGINLPRTTYEQVNVGTTVTGDLEPGDLIFFGDKVKPHHVGMYIGNGKYIQAPHTGDVIKISPIAGRGYSIAKRISK